MRPQPHHWGSLSDNAKRIVEIDWRSGIPKGDSLAASTAAFVGKPDGLTFTDVVIVGTKTRALMQHPGTVHGDTPFEIHAKVNVAGTGETLETEPAIGITIKAGGRY